MGASVHRLPTLRLCPTELLSPGRPYIVRMGSEATPHSKEDKLFSGTDSLMPGSLRHSRGRGKKCRRMPFCGCSCATYG